MNHFFILWGQQGGGAEIIWAIVFIIFVIFQFFRASFEARKAQAIQQQEDEERRKKSNDSKQQLQANRNHKKKDQYISSTFERKSLESENEVRRDRKKVLAKELAPQGEGRRFEADPGTLDMTSLIAPSIEPTVKPTLDSMTGIYEAAPTSSELQDQPLTSDIQKLIAKPEGIRQAIILAEILKRPEF